MTEKQECVFWPIMTFDGYWPDTNTHTADTAVRLCKFMHFNCMVITYSRS